MEKNELYDRLEFKPAVPWTWERWNAFGDDRMVDGGDLFDAKGEAVHRCGEFSSTNGNISQPQALRCMRISPELYLLVARLESFLRFACFQAKEHDWNRWDKEEAQELLLEARRLIQSV